jgi:hypothetical protein
MPRTLEVIRSEIAKPAASSLALLMRSPEDRRSMVMAKSSFERDSLRITASEFKFELMTMGMTSVSLRHVFRSVK